MTFSSFFQKFKSPQFLLKFVCIFVVYVVSAWGGLLLSGNIKQISLIWPATGVAVSALLIFGIEFWPAIFLGAFLVNFLTPTPFLVASGIAFGNTLEAYVATYFLNKFNFNLKLASAKDSILFIFFSSVLSTLISAFIGTSFLFFAKLVSLSNLRVAFFNWWLGDAVGSLVVAPFILVRSDLTAYFRQISVRTFVRTILLTTLLIFIGFLLFSPFLGTGFTNLPLEYLIFPVLILSSFQFKQVGSTWKILLISGISVWGTIMGYGPFVVRHGIQENLLLLQIFISILSITFLIFSALVEQTEDEAGMIDKSERRFRSLIEKSWEVVVLVDGNGTIAYSSPSIKRVLGYDPDELLGTNGFSIIYKDDRPESQKILGKLSKSFGKSEVLENRLIRKDGNTIWAQAIGTNLLNDESVKAIVINFRDISEHKKLDEARTEFVSMAAHELRGPLANIRWYIESISVSKLKLNTKVKNYISEIHSATIQMISLVNLLLNVSKIELGTLVTKIEKFDLVKVFKEVIATFDLQIEAKHLAIIENYESKDIYVKSDKNLTMIIVSNLLSNSIKYTNDGGKINIRASVDKNYFVIEVSDTGIGIPQNEQKSVFTKLFRADNVKGKYPSGSGLGLYLVKSLVAELRGEIDFKSEVNKGTNFVVKIPKDG